MNMVDAARSSVMALVDAEGRLVEAGARLLDLNDRAGGRIGAPVAVPQLARVIHLAQRLGVVVSRGIVAADGDYDVALWVRAEPAPDGEFVRLSVTGWMPRPPWESIDDAATRASDFAVSEGGWTWETDATLRLTYAGAGAAENDIEAADLIGQPLTDVFVLAEAAAGSLPILGALAMRTGFEDQPATRRVSGRSVMLSAMVRMDSAGNFAGFAGTVRHIAPVDSVSPPTALAGEPGLDDVFASRLDRALRKPLGRIIANADSIHAQSEGPLRQDYVGYAADIASAGRHLMGLVDDLVDLQAVERPDFVIAPEEIDLADVARRAAGLLAVRAANAGVRIDRPSLDETLPASGDFRRALQVLVNLIGNALRYSPPESMVWVRASSQDGLATIVVADQGKGIALADQARIFQKFERVDTSEPGGSGLGLYIARRLARAMDGDLVVDSAPGQGARFAFTLPARDA
ncbi:MAG: sensor histidine kinase [Sphingomonas sp.]